MANPTNLIRLLLEGKQGLGPGSQRGRMGVVHL